MVSERSTLLLNYTDDEIQRILCFELSNYTDAGRLLLEQEGRIRGIAQGTIEDMRFQILQHVARDCNCGECGAEIVLDDSDIVAGKFVCPSCRSSQFVAYHFLKKRRAITARKNLESTLADNQTLLAEIESQSVACHICGANNPSLRIPIYATRYKGRDYSTTLLTAAASAAIAAIAVPLIGRSLIRVALPEKKYEVFRTEFLLCPNCTTSNSHTLSDNSIIGLAVKYSKLLALLSRQCEYEFLTEKQYTAQFR